MEKGNIVLLNGVSSSGKSTLTKALQQRLDTPYYHICCDDFMNMTPKHFLDKDFDSNILVTQDIMHRTIALFSDGGHNVVVDDVILDLPENNDWMYEYVTMFSNHPVLFVRVDCPVEELERREKKRGDRSIGQSRWQLEHMNPDWPYDLVVNTFERTPDECADMIAGMLRKPDEWNAFHALKKRFDRERTSEL